MIKKTKNKEKIKATKSKENKDVQAKKVADVEEVKAEKVESGTTKKSTPKYHFSVKLTPEKLEKAEDAVHEAETEKKPFGTDNSKENVEKNTKEKAKEEKKQPTQTHFTKEAEAVSKAETPDKKDVEHIKYSDQKKASTPLASVVTSKVAPTSLAKKKCGGVCSTKKLSPKVEALKGPINELKSDPEAFKQLQNFVRPSLVTRAQNAIAKRGSLKYWNATLVGILKTIDLFISFITMSHGDGRNQAIQKARTPVLFGLWVFFIFFIIGGFWAGFAPLDKAANGTGFIVSTSQKQIIQHREGGIIEAIYVKEGDHVKTGQSLIKLSDKELRTKVNNLYSRKEGLEKHLELIQSQLKEFKELEAKGFIAHTQVIKQESEELQYKQQLDGVNAEIAISEEQLERLIVKSPVNGVVSQINVHTIGGTIGSGAHIMTVTPSEDDLLLEAYIQAKDIEPIHVGLKAKVMVSAFRSKTSSYLEGVVTYISPDVVDFVQQGRQTQEAMVLQQRAAFYKVKISIDKSQLKKISKVKDYELVPGMDAYVQIAFGERTLLQYLLDPILATFWHALKEK